MVASVAVLSDIHGVLPALEAVLNDPDVAGAERIVPTGDIAAGPQPVAVLDRLLDLGDRVTWVRGNADRELVTLARTRQSSNTSRAGHDMRVIRCWTGPVGQERLQHRSETSHGVHAMPSAHAPSRRR
jgi:predicted phosphodiesterase